jgi:hypothetical protein
MAVVEMDPVTGNRRIRSGCIEQDLLFCIGRKGGGPLFVAPTDLAIGLDGSLVIVDGFFDFTVIRIPPGSNERILVSGVDPDTRERKGRGPQVIPKGIAVQANDNLVVVGGNTLGTAAAVVGVNPTNGERILVSGVDPSMREPREPKGQGPLLRFPQRVDVAGNSLWLVDSRLQAVVHVDAESGNRTVVSGVDPNTGVLKGNGLRFVFPTSIAITAGNSLVVGDFGLQAVVRVDIGSGDRTVVAGVDPSTGEMKGGGPPLIFPRDIAVEANNSLVVADRGLRALVRVAPNGDRTIISRAIPGGALGK